MVAAKQKKKIRKGSGIFLEVVDDNGKPVCVLPKEQVLRQKLPHKGVVVCLRNSHGRVFLYRRHSSSRYSGLLGLGAAGDVLAGESYYAAAQRYLAEELAITDIDLTEVATFSYPSKMGNIRVTLYLTAKTSQLPMILEKGRQKNGMFVDKEELRALLRDFPHMVAPFVHLSAPYIF